MKDEFTTAMHAVLLSSEMSETDVKICGVYGAIGRGLTKKEALQKYLDALKKVQFGSCRNTLQ